MYIRYDEDIYVAEVRSKFPEGMHVLLFGLDGIPDNTKGVVDFVDDVGQVFVETEGKFKNVVLQARDEGVRIVKDCVNYPNVLSGKVCAIEEIEVDDVVSSFEPWDVNKEFTLCGFTGYAYLTDAFVASVPEYRHCLSDANDHFVNGYVTWNLEKNEVKLHTFLNDDTMKSAPQEFVLTGKDKEFVVNEFNKFFIKNYGVPTKPYFEFAKVEVMVEDHLAFYNVTADAVLNDDKLLNRFNISCKFNNLDKAREILSVVASKEKKDVSLEDKLIDANKRSDLTGNGKDGKNKENVDYGK